MRSGHHDDVGDAAGKAGYPKASSPTQLVRDKTCCTGADEGTQRHERRDQLLSFRGYVPARGGRRRPVTVDLDSISTSRKLRREQSTSKKPTIACSPPIIPKSIPYWNGLRIITPQATNKRQCVVHDSFFASAIMMEDRTTNPIVHGESRFTGAGPF